MSRKLDEDLLHKILQIQCMSRINTVEILHVEMEILYAVWV